MKKIKNPIENIRKYWRLGGKYEILVILHDKMASQEKEIRRRIKEETENHLYPRTRMLNPKTMLVTGKENVLDETVWRILNEYALAMQVRKQKISRRIWYRR